MHELNLDGLPGPSHNFGGLASGNLASMKHRFETSRPRLAAMQGLDKMKRVYDLGIPVAVMPPHQRPCLPVLRELGFSGSDGELLSAARREAPELFYGAWSSSAMWSANAATVSPAADSRDGRVHFSPANLVSQFHRALEADFTSRLLKRIFPPGPHFAHHPPLPANAALRDEGAANHLRFWDVTNDGDSPGVEVFVYGAAAYPSSGQSRAPSRFPARQTLEASQAVARRHGLDSRRTLFLEQNPAAIDAGVFHNDVISVAHEHLLLYHEDAFAAGEDAVDQIRNAFPALVTVRVSRDELSVEEAVQTYLFNSLLLSLPDREGEFALFLPEECRNHDRARDCVERILAGTNPVSEVHYVPLRESMKNGGGPACLRLRVALDDQALAGMHAGIRYTPELDGELRRWVETHYREELRFNDLVDPQLIEESNVALDLLTQILELGAIYEFQRISASEGKEPS